MHLELTDRPAQDIDADTLLFPVDGRRPAPGGGVIRAIRASLSADDAESMRDELDFLDEELAALRLPDGGAAMLTGVGRWDQLLVSAAYPHNVNGALFEPPQYMDLIRRALPHALEFAESDPTLTVGGRPTDQPATIRRVTMTLIGTAYRVSMEQSVRAIGDALIAAHRAGRSQHVIWSLPVEGALDAATSLMATADISTVIS